MKILMVNKFHYIKGGSETYYFALKKQLENLGHQVIDFSMTDEKNFDSPYKDYFVDHVDYSGDGGIKKKVRMAANIIYSFEAKKKFEQLVLDEAPDLVHLHIFQHQISPSILDIVKKYHIPCVYTAHDLKMVCLNYKMMHHGKICEDCKDGHYGHCLKNRCVKESALKSSINVAEGYLHRWRKSYDTIDYVITPSNFYRDKMIEFGVDEKRLVHIPNFLDREKPHFNVTEDHKNYYLYFGRISEEKGVGTLIDAFKRLDIKLKIVGTGPLKEHYEAYVKKLKLNHVELLGFKSGQELTDLVANAKAVILPSEWYENGPYSAIESLQLGRPVLGADIGGIPELIRENGFLFRSGNSGDLNKKVLKMEALNMDEYKAMEEASYKLFEECYTWKSHMSQLFAIYNKSIEDKH